MMRRVVLTLASSLVFASLGFGQEEFHHNNITVGGGAAVPVGTATNYGGRWLAVSCKTGTEQESVVAAKELKPDRLQR